MTTLKLTKTETEIFLGLSYTLKDATNVLGLKYQNLENALDTASRAAFESEDDQDDRHVPHLQHHVDEFCYLIDMMREWERRLDQAKKDSRIKLNL
jgi:hypothetical protein